MGNNQPPMQWVPGLFPGVCRSEREADPSAPSDAEFKTVCTDISTLPLCLRGVSITCTGGTIQKRIFIPQFVFSLNFSSTPYNYSADILSME